MKKLLTLLLCAVSLCLTTHTVLAEDIEFNEFSPERYDGWGFEDCENETISWTTTIGLDTHKQVFEDRTGAKPDSSDLTSNAFAGGIVVIAIPDNQILDEDSVSISIPLYIVNKDGFMTEYYYEANITFAFVKVSSSGYTSLDAFIATLQANQYGIYTEVDSVTGKESSIIALNLMSFRLGFNLEVYSTYLNSLEEDFDLDSVDDADLINNTRQVNNGLGYGMHVNFDVGVVEPDNTLSVFATVTENNQQSVTKEITVPYCHQAIGTLEIHNLDEQGQPLPNVEFFVDILDEQTFEYIPYVVNGQAVSVVTDEQGIATISELPNGTYRLRQSTPAGYTEGQYSPQNEFVIDDITTTHNVTVTNSIDKTVEVIINWETFYDKYGWIPNEEVSILILFDDIIQKVIILSVQDDMIWYNQFVDSSDLLENDRLRFEIDGSPWYTFGYSTNHHGNVLTFNIESLIWEPNVEIVWVDNDNEDGMRPDSLIVTLMENGVPHAVHKVIYKDGNSWFVVFEKIEYTPNAIYTFDVNEVDGYEKSFENGKIIMTRVKAPDVPPVPDENPSSPEEITPDTEPNEMVTLPNTGVYSTLGDLTFVGLILVAFGLNKRKHDKSEV